MICGFLAPGAGTISMAVRPEWGGARRAIGYCPQEIMVWETLSCREQLVFMGRVHDLGGRRAKARADFLLEALGLAERSRSLAKTLSGGMRRRLNIALALVHEPELVVLDEPQAGLDPQGRVLVREFVRSLRSTSSVLLTTHDMEEADRLADRVAIMDGGRILALDSPEGLRASEGAAEVVEVRRRTLEDVFIGLTGRRLRE